MRSVEAAQAALLALCTPLAAETILISKAHGRVLARDVCAARTHPPFAASAMDGYAVRSCDVATLPVSLRLTGESVAGKRFTGTVGVGEAVRIFTGAPLPHGADCVIVQEDVCRANDLVTVQDKPVHFDQHIRPAGLDAQAGALVAMRGTPVSPALQGFLAACGIVEVAAVRQPKVQLLACGDELKLPGAPLGPDDIVASNNLVLAALLHGVEVTGADQIISDDLALLTQSISQSNADVLITIGGASVGERDFVQAALKAAGCDIAFWKIALKPGKPLMVGKRGAQIVIGLPGNPVSAYVCTLLFVLPALRALQGQAQPLPQLWQGITAVDLPATGGRAEYLRATADLRDGVWRLAPHARQDSSMLSILAASNALLQRPADAPAAPAGAAVGFLPIMA